MIEFSNFITVAPLGGKTTFDFIVDEFASYAPTTSDDAAGLCWNCDRTWIIDIPSSDVLSYFSIYRSVIITIRSQSRNYQIGSGNMPAKVIITPNLAKAQLIMTCKSLKHPLL